MKMLGGKAVSTHSRLKAAGRRNVYYSAALQVSTHSRLKAAGGWQAWYGEVSRVSTHSRLKAAGWAARRWWYLWRVSTHSRLKAAGHPARCDYAGACRFNTQPPKGGWLRKRGLGRPALVSTHSRLKAAGASLKSLAPSGFAAPISLSSQEKREREYSTAFSVTPTFTIS